MGEVCGNQEFFTSMVTCMSCVLSLLSCGVLGRMLFHSSSFPVRHFGYSGSTGSCCISRQSLFLILSSLFLSFPLSTACVCTRVSGVKCGCVPPSAVEGEYNPWERELQQGLWLQCLSDEEDSGTQKGTRTPSPLPLPQRSGECIKEQVPHEEFLCFI